VPAGPGWDLTSVFSDDLSNTTITGATWEIRTGVSAGKSRYVGCQRQHSNADSYSYRPNAFGFTEFQVEVAIFAPLHLPPWQQANSIGSTSRWWQRRGRAFDSQTSGANAVGMLQAMT